LLLLVGLVAWLELSKTKEIVGQRWSHLSHVQLGKLYVYCVSQNYSQLYCVLVLFRLWSNVRAQPVHYHVLCHSVNCQLYAKEIRTFVLHRIGPKLLFETLTNISYLLFYLTIQSVIK
jgi:hypothetical protein